MTYVSFMVLIPRDKLDEVSSVFRVKTKDEVEYEFSKHDKDGYTFVIIDGKSLIETTHVYYMPDWEIHCVLAEEMALLILQKYPYASIISIIS